MSWLADDLADLLRQYTKLKIEVAKAQSRIQGHEPDSFELYAIGAILHDMYHGAENICRRVAKELDQKLPARESWHRLLLDQMTNPLDIRPPVIQLKTAQQLDEYRKFRHVVRNIYSFDLDWSRMKPLLDNAESTMDIFVSDLEQFIAFLRLMSENDETDP